MAQGLERRGIYLADHARPDLPSPPRRPRRGRVVPRWGSARFQVADGGCTVQGNKSEAADPLKGRGGQSHQLGDIYLDACSTAPSAFNCEFDRPGRYAGGDVKPEHEPSARIGVHVELRCWPSERSQIRSWYRKAAVSCCTDFHALIWVERGGQGHDGLHLVANPSSVPRNGGCRSVIRVIRELQSDGR